MAVAYYGSHISEHLVKTPEGYLICYDARRCIRRESWAWKENRSGQ